MDTYVLYSYWTVLSSSSSNTTNFTLTSSNYNFTYNPNIVFSLSNSNYSSEDGLYLVSSYSDLTQTIDNYNITYELTYSGISLEDTNSSTLVDNVQLLDTTIINNYTVSQSILNDSPTFSTQNIAYHSCSLCNTSDVFTSGCSRCNVTNCLECSKGRALVEVSNECLECELQDSINPFLYWFKDYRCSECEDTSATTCSYCDIGFQNSNYDSS